MPSNNFDWKNTDRPILVWRTLGQILDHSRITVPAYQRDFVWGELQATQICDDLKTITDIDGPRSHHVRFLGTTLLELSQAMD